MSITGYTQESKHKVQNSDAKYQYYFNLGKIAMDSSEDINVAVKYFDSAMLIKPNNNNAIFNRALCYIILDSNILAIQDLTIYIKSVSNDAQAFGFRASAKLNIKDSIGSLKDYDSSIKYNPNDYDTRLERAKLFRFLKNNIDSAFSDINIAIKIDSTKPYGYYLKGLFEYFKGDYNSSLINFQKSVSIDSSDSRSFYYIGRILNDQKKYNESEKYFTFAIKINDKDPNYYINRAISRYNNDNDYDDDLACDDLYSALKLGSEDAKKMIDKYCNEEDDN